MCMKYIALGLQAKVSCIVVICLRIADPWTNHDQTGDATFSFWGTRLQRWCRAFLFILLMGLPAGLSQGPPCHQVHNLGTSVQLLPKKKAPAEFQKVSAMCLVFSRRECHAVDDEDEYVLLTIHD